MEFLIHGWSEKPLIRSGESWMKFSGQTAKFQKAVKALNPGDRVPMLFKNGYTYEVERVK